MDKKIEINHIAFVWRDRKDSFDKFIKENLLDRLDNRITIYNANDYSDSSFFYQWKINSRYLGDLRLEMQYPVLVIMLNGRPHISKYYSELKRYLKSNLDLTVMASQINKKVNKMVEQYGFEPSLMGFDK